MHPGSGAELPTCAHSRYCTVRDATTLVMLMLTLTQVNSRLASYFKVNRPILLRPNSYALNSLIALLSRAKTTCFGVVGPASTPHM